MNTVDDILPINELDETLRPTKLDHFIGQDKVKEGLSIFIQAAKKRKEPLSHVLIHGAPGLGKTTLATIIAHELGVNIRVTSGPALERTGDLAAILSNLEEGDVFFIDEIHRMQRSIEEILYPAMEDFAIDIILGKGPSARSMRLDIPKFTLVGATTRVGALSSPLRDRFGVVYNLDFYTVSDLEKVITRSAKILGITIAPTGATVIARRSRRTPRIANRLLQRVRDYVQVKGDGTIDGGSAHRALELLEVDTLGLDATDRRVLLTLAEKFEGGPVGLKTLAAATHEDTETLEIVIEPFLLQMGFLDRTPQGRKLTPLGKKHITKQKGIHI
ncbi:Holliday junction branch migration DNA helicase RuvB [Candidatus Berkelbacteria bacterium]|nr:Holliday junction branch migration DNA helicase RuvB [Candidatus Berkelbacteria bacterium]OIP06281.1 MAG: Holliday junction DNA helicase RuvB [Candidatus Berkelbacteria bacterium CG2_30_43_20]